MTDEIVPRKPLVRRLLMLVAWAVGITALIAAVMVVPMWLEAITPRWVVRGATVGILWSILIAFLATLLVAPVGIAVSAWTIRRARSRGGPWLGAARGLTLFLTCLIAMGMLEPAAAVIQVRSHAAPKLPTKFQTPPAPPEASRPLDRRDLPRAADGALRLVVIGESSASGEPYDPWLSVGQIVGWQLERTLGRHVLVDMRSRGGINLEGAIDRLKGLETRPDAILIYCGHNEFQARYNWSRSVSHYVIEQPYRAPHEIFLEAVAGHSSLGSLVRELLERHQLDMAPPRKSDRKLVDVPAYTPGEYRELLTDFRARLERLVAYCDAIGALPIFVIPPGNDGGFPPLRSVMSADSTALERAAFTREFLITKALELSDPPRAEAWYRDALVRQPGFAETHYRLARLLLLAGRDVEARRHFIAARDLDGMPVRCTSDFQQVYRDIAARSHAVLVDGPAVLSALAPNGIVDDALIHDAQHPTLAGYTALARSTLQQLHARRAFDWPETSQLPTLTTADCATHFAMDPARWEQVCDRTINFYGWATNWRYDPSEFQRNYELYQEAKRRILSGTAPRETGVPGLSF